MDCRDGVIKGSGASCGAMGLRLGSEDRRPITVLALRHENFGFYMISAVPDSLVAIRS